MFLQAQWPAPGWDYCFERIPNLAISLRRCFYRAQQCRYLVSMMKRLCPSHFCSHCYDLLESYAALVRFMFTLLLMEGHGREGRRMV